MKEYWWIFAISIVCAIFSKQIDNTFSKLIADRKKRFVIYGVISFAFLVIVGALIYNAISLAFDGWSFTLAISLLAVFIAAVGIGIFAGRTKNKKSTN